MSDKRRGTFTLTEDEWARLRSLAGNANQSMNEYVRQLINRAWQEEQHP